MGAGASTLGARRQCLNLKFDALKAQSEFQCRIGERKRSSCRCDELSLRMSRVVGRLPWLGVCRELGRQASDKP